MQTIDCNGTYFKFITVAKYIHGALGGEDPGPIHMVGNGKCQGTGMYMALREFFPTADYHFWDPLAYAPLYQTKPEMRAYDPVPDAKTAGIVISDVAFSAQDSFCEEYTKDFADKLVAAQEFYSLRLIVYKTHTRYMDDHAHDFTVFGRGHNAEAFVVRSLEGPHHFHSHQQLQLLSQEKGKCNQLRNLMIIRPGTPINCTNREGQKALTRVCTLQAPNKKWSKDRSFSVEDTLSVFLNRLDHDRLSESGSIVYKSLLRLQRLAPEISMQKIVSHPQRLVEHVLKMRTTRHDENLKRDDMANSSRKKKARERINEIIKSGSFRDYLEPEGLSLKGPLQHFQFDYAIRLDDDITFDEQ